MKGATSHVILLLPQAMHFNPRTHEGCDENFIKFIDFITQISIHAPMKGATAQEMYNRMIEAKFQSTHP